MNLEFILLSLRNLAVFSPHSVQNKVFLNATCTDARQERKYVSGKMP